MRNLRCNLIYWGWTLEKTVILMFAWILLMWGILTFMEGGSFAESAAQLWIYYYVMAFFIFSVSTTFSEVNTYFPFTVSMGSTRKASFIAMQIIQHLILSEYVVLAGVICYVTRRDVFEGLMPYFLTVIGAVLLLQAFLNFVSMLCVRFGSGTGFIVYILFVAVFFAIISYCAVSGLLNNTDFIDVLENFAKMPYLLGIGGVLDAVWAGIYYLFLRRQNLRI